MTKVYVQLQPTESSLLKISHFQDTLPKMKSERVVSSTEIHLTVIHIGRLDRLLDSVRHHTLMPHVEIMNKIATMIDSLTQLVNLHSTNTFSLDPTGVDYFGSAGSTLVLTLGSNSELTLLHRDSLFILQEFLSGIGIQDIIAFMQQDFNLRHALSLRPHVTIIKSYSEHVGFTNTGPLSFTVMPVVY